MTHSPPRPRTVGPHPAPERDEVSGGIVARTGFALIVVCVALACGPAEPSADHRITLRVLDGHVREVGVECAGARPFLDVHVGTSFQVTDEEGDVLAVGELPSGTSVEAYDEDLEVDRIPTYCDFELEVELADRDAYRLVLDGRAPLRFTSDGTAHVVTIP